jgi:carbon starvation protein CstA
LLQPRGYLGGFFLYLTLGGGLLGLLWSSPTIEWPAFTGFTANGQTLVPFLFITIACGACSGFHGLVCSGTTSKQLDRESDAHLVGYGGMLLEGVVALLALACVMLLPRDSQLAGAGADKIFGVGVGSFLHQIGVPLQFAVAFGMLAFATFVYDTLDVCTRLARYLFCEFTGWRTGPAGSSSVSGTGMGVRAIAANIRTVAADIAAIASQTEKTAVGSISASAAARRNLAGNPAKSGNPAVENAPTRTAAHANGYDRRAAVISDRREGIPSDCIPESPADHKSTAPLRAANSGK